VVFCFYRSQKKGTKMQIFGVLIGGLGNSFFSPPIKGIMT